MACVQIIDELNPIIVTEDTGSELTTEDSTTCPPNPPFPPPSPPFCVLEPIPAYTVPMQALDEPSELIGS